MEGIRRDKFFEKKKIMTDLLSIERLKKSENDSRRTKGTFEYDYRTPIESDLGRVIFSPASRRLHDKTQVFPLTSDDNIHSRLTHSMEVMSLGRSFALFLSKYKGFCDLVGKGVDDSVLLRDLEAIMSTVCLTHDIGNPPFGHFGETAIQQYFSHLFDAMSRDVDEIKEKRPCQSLIMQHLFYGLKDEKEIRSKLNEVQAFLNNEFLKYDYIQFDGNAEGFRVLTKLQFLNDLYGMNLTSASLAAYLKYPNCGERKKKDDNIALHKHGVFVTERDRMEDAMVNCGISKANDKAYNRHPFAFFMEAADSICYLCMDIEDAFSKRWIDYKDITKAIDASKNLVWDKLLKQAEMHFKEKDPEIRKVVQLRTEIMAYLQKVACQNFKNHFEEILKGEYGEELIKDDENRIAKQLGDFCVEKIFTNREIESLEITGNAVIKGIMDTYVDLLFNPKADYRNRGKNLISRSVVMTVLQEHYDSKKERKIAHESISSFDVNEFTIEERFRIIRDFVAGMTDRFALNHYQRLSGQKL